MDLVEARAPRGFDHVDRVVSPTELDDIASAYRRTAGFDPATLNSRPSLSVGERYPARRSGLCTAT